MLGSFLNVDRLEMPNDHFVCGKICCILVKLVNFLWCVGHCSREVGTTYALVPAGLEGGDMAPLSPIVPSLLDSVMYTDTKNMRA